MISSLVAVGIAALLRRYVPLWVSVPIVELILVLSYYRFMQPRIENALSGTVCEPTQKDCYRTEDESEVTDR